MTDVESRIAAVVERTTTHVAAAPSIEAVRRGAQRRQRRHRLAGATAAIAVLAGCLAGALTLRSPAITITITTTNESEPWMILPTETLGLPLQILTVEGNDIPPDGSNQQVFSTGHDGRA